jgi:translation initiation factor 1
MTMGNNSRPVYSTDAGRLCPECGQATSACRCRTTTNSGSDGDGIVRLRRESKGRGGKTVTLVEGLPGDRDALKQWARRLKQHCGVGGGVKEGRIEVQGEQRERIAGLLRAEGLTVKIAGG